MEGVSGFFCLVFGFFFLFLCLFLPFFFFFATKASMSSGAGDIWVCLLHWAPVLCDCTSDNSNNIIAGTVDFVFILLVNCGYNSHDKRF